LLPSKCCIRVRGKECVNTPEWIVSILDHENEYMIAFVCNEHRGVIARIIEGRIDQLYSNNNDRCILRFTKIKRVATACSL